jgi:hypothetical protein
MAYTETEAVLLNINYKLLKSIIELQKVAQGLTPTDDREAQLRIYDLSMAVNDVITMFENLPKQ